MIKKLLPVFLVLAATVFGANVQIRDLATTITLASSNTFLIADGATQGTVKFNLAALPVITSTRATLAGLSVTGISTGVAVQTLGGVSAGDGLGALFYYNSASSATPNGVTIIQPTVGSGRWLIVLSNSLPAPTVSTLGGVFSSTAVANQYLTGIATDGTVTRAAITTANVSGLGTMAAQNATAVAITGGAINGAIIGATGPVAGRFSHADAVSGGYIGIGTGGTAFANFEADTAAASMRLFDTTSLGSNIILTTQADGVVGRNGMISSGEFYFKTGAYPGTTIGRMTSTGLNGMVIGQTTAAAGTFSNIIATSGTFGITQIDTIKLVPELGYPTGGSVTLRFDLKTNLYIPLTVDAAFNFSGMVSGSTMIATLKNSTAGTLTLSWPGTVNVTGTPLPTSLSPGQSVVVRAEAYGPALTDVFAQSVTANLSSATPSLVTLKALAGLSDGQQVVLLGYYAPGDGGGGLFFWDASNTATDNGGTVIQLTAGGTGRFCRVVAGTSITALKNATLDVRWFGAIPDGASTVTARVQAAYDAIPAAGSGCLYFPSGSYVFNTRVQCTGLKSITVKGDGVNATKMIYNTASDGMWEFDGSVDMHDIGFVNVNGTNPNPFVLISAYGALSKFHDLNFDAFYNVILIKISQSYVDVDEIKAFSLNGCQIWIEASGGRVSNCYLSAGDGNGISYWPCFIYRGLGGAPVTSLAVSNVTLRGAGPWTPYDGGTMRSTLLVSTDAGTVNESSFTNIFIDTTSGTGVPANTVGALFDGVSGAGTYIMGGFVLADFYINGAETGIKLDGVDSGAAKSVSGFALSNIYSLPNSGFGGVTIRGATSVNLNGTMPRGNGGGYGVLVQAQGSQWTENIWINGVQTASAPNATSCGVRCDGALIRNVSAMFGAWNSTSAPYSLVNGAAKANAISFTWPDSSGGMNFSGAVTPNQ